MSDIFSSARSVLRRADHHINDLERAVGIFTADKPYTYVIEYDTEIGKYAHKAVFSETYSEDVSCIMFDAVNNLRSCLDQITFAVQNRSTGLESTNYFPFAKDAQHWPARIKGIQNLPPEIVSIFEGFKGYKGGNDALYALHFLANTKKHALLVPVAMGSTLAMMPTRLSKAINLIQPKRTRKNEITFAISDEEYAQAQIQLSYSIVINHPEEVIRGHSPVRLLKTIRSEVERVLVATEAECRRLGMIA